MRILLIDSESSQRAIIETVIKELDATSELESFGSLAELKQKQAEVSLEEIAKFNQFHVVIFDYKLLEESKWGNQLAEMKAYCAEDVQFYFSAYDDVHLNRKGIFNLGVANIFYKPFDVLVLKEFLNIALKPKKNVRPIEVTAQSAAAFVAILKEIEIQTISELGFVTVSDSEITLGSVSKYFSKMFSFGRKQSVLAQCLVCIPHPQKPGHFINKFQYIAPEPNFLKIIRQYVKNHDSQKVPAGLWNLSEPKNPETVLIGLVATKNPQAEALQNEIQGHYSNVKVEFVDLSDKAKIHNYKWVLNFSTLSLDVLRKHFEANANYFLISNATLSEDEINKFSTEYRDLFLFPLDRSYFYKKLKIHVSDLAHNEPPYMVNVHAHEKVKAANMVKISEICEAFVNINYQRELPVGTFREFVFVGEDENDIIELPAFCHFTEKSKNPPAGEKRQMYFHQFVFWGMTDHYLTQIRLWLRLNYIVQKNANG